jgi:hypothetical protein
MNPSDTRWHTDCIMEGETIRDLEEDMRTRGHLFITMLFIGVMLFFGGATQQANATAQIDFAVVAPALGSISYAGGASPLVGTNVTIREVTGINGTPDNNNVTLQITGGLLNFRTGLYTGGGAAQWDFGGGADSFITVTGGIAALGIPNDSVLLTGAFGSASVLPFGGESFKIAGSSFSDQKNPTLANYYGLLAPFITGWNGNFNISFNAVGLPPNPFSSESMGSGDLINTPVPEPGTLLLLGSGLVGAFVFTRKRR